MTRNISLPYPRRSSCRGRERPRSPAVWAGAALAAALAAGCVPSTPATSPTAPSTPTAPASGTADMAPGTHVQVVRQGQWYGATVVMAAGEGRFLVHYDGTGNEWNESVGPDRIKPLPAPAAVPVPGRDYGPGEKVLVTYQNRLLLAEVVSQVSADSFRVHYDGYGAEGAETVGPERMRRPFTGNTAHAPGDGVTVDVNGQSVPGKVLAASAADRWVVRFEAFGPQYDQEVGVDRIKVAPAVVAPPPPPVTAQKAVEKPEKPIEKPEKPPAEVAPAPQAGPPAIDEKVLVGVRGAWFAATVTGLGATGRVKVKFASGGEEDVEIERVLREPAATKSLPYQPGQLVLVDYKGVFVPAKVLKPEGKGEYKVRFEGQGPDGDEVIQVRRLRPR
jgi:hypothetical protein